MENTVSSTLKETLKRLECKDVAIGTAQGSNFLYIGKADNVDLIEQIFKDYHDRIENEKLPATKKAIQKAMRGIDKKGKLIEQAKEIVKLVETLEKYEEYVEGYVDPMKRRIFDIYESEIDEKGEPIRVIVTGMEKGEFWFKSEFDLKYGNK